MAKKLDRGIKQYNELKQYRCDKTPMPPYMRSNDTITPRWVPIPCDLVTSPQYKKLNHRTARLLIDLYIRQADGQQQNCLYRALTDYNQIYDLGMTEDDISRESYHINIKGNKYSAGLFTASRKQMEDYGFIPSAVTRCMEELEEAGFIETVWNGKGRYSAWDKNQTVYVFSDKWRKT